MSDVTLSEDGSLRVAPLEWTSASLDPVRVDTGLVFVEARVWASRLANEDENEEPLAVVAAPALLGGD